MNIFKNAKSIITTTGTDLYVAPVARQATVHSLFLSNISPTPVRATVLVDDIRILMNKEISANNTYTLDKSINLSEGQNLRIIAVDGNNTIEAFASIIEGSEGATFIENGIPSITLLPSDLTKDDVVNGVELVSVSNIMHYQFDPEVNGAVWGTFNLPDPWSRNDDIDVIIQYQMLGGFDTKSVLLEVSIWALDLTTVFDVNNPIQTSSKLIEVTPENTGIITIDNICSILNLNIAETDKLIVVSLTRVADDEADDFTGTFNLLSLELVPRVINGNYDNILINDIIGFNVQAAKDKDILQFNESSGDWEVGPGAVQSINDLVNGTAEMHDMIVFNGVEWVFSKEPNVINHYNSWKIIDTDKSLAVSDRLFVDTSTQSIKLYLPITANIGDEIIISDFKGTFSTNNVTVVHNTNFVNSMFEDMILSLSNLTVMFVYSGPSNGWIVGTSTDNSNDKLNKQSWVNLKTSAVLSDGDDVLLDTRLDPITITPPILPVLGTEFSVIDVNGNFSTNSVTINRQDNLIMGNSEDLVINSSRYAGTFVYTTADIGWKVLNTYVCKSSKPWEIISDDSTVTHGSKLFIDTSTKAISITLPASPMLGEEITIVDLSESFSTNPVTFIRNGQPIMNIDDDLTVSTTNLSFSLVYTDSVMGWILVK